ncbi:hypothetical protein J4E93_004387 [Alternaria ventricosa]|uniref:uncharacterized protein n=1 Tax=Alternaria ventricosa TaxID=1187951 RepID=UPI0020C3483A|nr:uncharacterized protein J4E93_004387 [Alternaria ventricosa]KAI4647976.1 hypothetical protein J4E93_004387 [Alternaria ventricosa]
MATAVTSTSDAAEIPGPIPCAYPPAKPPAHVYDTIITIAVGPDNAKKKFKIYRGLLCHFSSYFDRMLNGSFKECGSTYLRLKDIDAETFNVFYYWLNSGVVDCMDNAAQFHWTKAMTVYVFADFHQASIFKNAVLDSLYRFWVAERQVRVGVTEFLYTNTSEGDGMRKLIVDILITTGGFRKCDKARLFNCHK